jgi:Tfp pilus assembly protein PilF
MSKKTVKNQIRKAESNVKKSGENAVRSALPNNKTKYFVFAALAVLCLVIYAQSFGFDFINLDDDLYVYENPFVWKGFNPANLSWALTAFHASNWHPLTWISHQLDASFFGMNAGAHHAVNVIFHIANSILLFTVVKKLTGGVWRSAAVAALFAVHPAHVESVAWIAERKDVLSTLFWLLTMWAYLRFVKQEEKRRKEEKETNAETSGNYGESEKISSSPLLIFSSSYLLIVFLFALGLMAKPMLVTLPFTLVLLDYWALERFERWNFKNLLPLVVEKIPLFALSAISAALTILAQKAGGAIQSVETISLSDRIINAVVAYAEYFVMLFYPVNLGVWYPFDNNFSTPMVIASIVFLIVVTAICLWQIRERKYLFVGWFWFLGTLVPVIGILQVGRQALADRYTYVPYIGLSIAVVWLLSEVFERLKLNKTAIVAVCAACILALTAIAFRQTSFWKTSETLYARALSVTGKNYLVKNNLCDYLDKKNRLDEAAAQCQSAISDNPELPDAYNTLGAIQLKQNKFDAARANFEKAVALKPDFVFGYANLSLVAMNQNDFDAAGENLKKAIEIDRGGFFDSQKQLEAYSGLAFAAFRQKRYDKAAEFFRKSLEIAPANAEFSRNLGMSLHKQGKSAEGIKILEETIRKNPNLPEVYNTLGLIYVEQYRREEAIAQFQKALQVNPNFTPAQSNLKKALELK